MLREACSEGWTQHSRRIGIGRRRRATGIQRLREPEVQHLDDIIGAYLDVGWFQIAMDDTAFVRRFERVDDLRGDRKRILEYERTSRQTLREIFSVNELHDLDRGEWRDAQCE